MLQEDDPRDQMSLGGGEAAEGETFAAQVCDSLNGTIGRDDDHRPVFRPALGIEPAHKRDDAVLGVSLNG